MDESSDSCKLLLFVIIQIGKNPEFLKIKKLTLFRMGGGPKRLPLPVFPLQFFQTQELAPKTF